ncbi:MAG TPA: hypothetical protein VHP83_16320 [Aggregatilineaceae bacterium]|nr:hypothetical protein [Aggregatilineaceae bacterium]
MATSINNSEAMREVIDGKIAELVEDIRENQEQIAVLENHIKAAKEQLRDLLDLRGSSWTDAAGYARIAADSIRKSYDGKSLDALILSDPLLYGWLKDYRKESVVRGGVQVR